MTGRPELGDGEDAGSYVDKTMPSVQNCSTKDNMVDIKKGGSNPQPAKNGGHVLTEFQVLHDDEEEKHPSNNTCATRPLLWKLADARQ